MSRNYKTPVSELTLLAPGDKLLCINNKGVEDILNEGERYTFEAWEDGENLSITEMVPSFHMSRFAKMGYR